MRRQLPDYFNPDHLADSGATIEGIWPKARFDRLLNIPELVPGDIRLKLRFSRRVSGNIVIDGRILAELQLFCQRCLQLFDWRIDDDVHLLVAKDEQEPVQDADYELLPVDDERNVEMLQLIETEIIVRLPDYPVHAQISECDQKMLRQREDTDANGTSGNNPFAILKQLK